MNKAQSPPPISRSRLARLWPNREHESNWLKALLCRFGMHRWHTVNLGKEDPQNGAVFCRWCSEIKLDGKAIN